VSIYLNLTLFSLLLQCFSGTLFAQEIKGSLQDSSSVLVIGEQESNSDGLIDAPVKVEVVGDEQIKKQQYQDLSETLTEIPGVSTTSTSRRAGSKSALIQGFGESSVLVMIDGTPVSQNNSFGFDLTQVSTSDIEKVEVIKGGASSLYGSQAMGGVINVVTKKVGRKNKIEMEGSGGWVSGGEGGGNRNLKVTIDRKISRAGLKASISHRDQDSFDLDPSSITKDGAASTRQHGSLKVEGKYGRRTYFAKGMFLRGKVESETSRPYSSSAFGASLNTTDTTSQNFKIGTEEKLGTGLLRSELNFEINKDKLSLNDNPLTPFTETLKETRFEGRRLDLKYKNFKIGDHEVTTGLLIRENIVDQQTTTEAVPGNIVKTIDIENKSISSYESFVQDTFWLGNFEVSPGIRYQYDKDFGSHISPKVNLSHFADIGEVGLKSWVTVGTGYRAPSIKERFFTLDHSSVANYIVVGNKNLSPEQSVSLQLGEEVQFSKTSLYGNLFLNKISNLIESIERPGEGSGRIFSYENLEEVISRGVEFGIKSEVLPKLNLKLNGSYTEAINRNSNLLLANRPLYSGMFSAAYQVIDSLSLISSTNYTGSSYIDQDNKDISPSFLTTNLKLNYQINKQLKSFFRINNLLDTTRDAGQDLVNPKIDNRPAEGRSFFMGFNMTVL
jgi:outer membrane receptor for ferrienterochelin and colicins